MELMEIHKKAKPEIFWDLDGVLVDFDKQFTKISEGISPREYEKKFGIDKFWSIIDKEGTKFWSEMETIKGAINMFKYTLQYNPKILSAPSRHPSSRIGKKEWVDKYLPGTHLILASASNKRHYSGENKILIDDRKSNIDQWISDGGIGILHISPKDTIEQLIKMGL